MKKLLIILLASICLFGCQAKGKEEKEQNEQQEAIQQETEQERIAKEQAEKAKAELERIAKEQEEQERIAKEQAEKEKQATIRTEVKEAIDAYEQFVDEYCKFLKKYNTTSDPTSLLMDYFNYLNKLEQFTTKMDNLQDDFTDAELQYYTVVYLRCTEKMLKAAQ